MGILVPSPSSMWLGLGTGWSRRCRQGDPRRFRSGLVESEKISETAPFLFRGASGAFGPNTGRSEHLFPPLHVFRRGCQVLKIMRDRSGADAVLQDGDYLDRAGHLTGEGGD